MKLSIIVPVYGVEKYIKQCITSLLLPNYNDYEIIIVNDGTKDRSIEIVRESFNDSRIRIIEQDNAGLSAARNRGIREARGEYVWVFDSDDWADTNALSILISTLSDVDVVFMTSHYLNFESTGTEEIVHNSNNATNSVGLVCGNYVAPAPFYIYRKAVLLKQPEHLFTQGILHEDCLFTPIALLRANLVKCYHEPIYHYRQREGSITQVVSPKRLMDYVYIIKTLSNYGYNHIDKSYRYKWGKCVVEDLNGMMYLAQQCDDSVTIDIIKKFVNNNYRLYRYFMASDLTCKLLGGLAWLTFGNFWTAYRLLYKVRYCRVFCVKTA